MAPVASVRRGGGSPSLAAGSPAGIPGLAGKDRAGCGPADAI